ncbi:unnamed protein product, partial [Didymodactylos carnosus]
MAVSSPTSTDNDLITINNNNSSIKTAAESNGNSVAGGDRLPTLSDVPAIDSSKRIVKIVKSDNTGL